MTELGLNELKKTLMALALPAIFIIFILLITMSAFSATSSEEVSSVNGLLATEEGQKLYNDIWKKPLQEVYEETHVSVHIAWVYVPSIMIDDPYSISHDRAKEIIMLALDKDGDVYQETELKTYIDRLLKEPEFKELDREKLIDIITRNEEKSDLTTIGNIPKDLDKYLQLETSLPVTGWSGIGEVGMYNPFGEWRMHHGMDIAVPTGTPLYAAMDGTVEVVYYSETGGNTFMMRNGTLVVIYCHMRELSFKKPGDTVKHGELVGYTGSTGRVTGPHLHFETWSTDLVNVREGFNHTSEIFFNPRLIWKFD